MTVPGGSGAHADASYLLDPAGPAAPPRDNGELVFAAPWEGQAFGVVQRERHAERPALPRRGEYELAVVARRRGRAGRIEQIGRISAAGREGHGTATWATPTMASRVTRSASSASE